MTCIEKVKKERPELIDSESWSGCRGCPHMVGYMPRPGYCPYVGNEFNMLSMDAQRILCTECWNREIPEPKEEPKTKPTEQEPDTAPSEPTEQKSSIPSMTDLQWLMRKGLGYPGVAVSITFREDSINFTAYPFSEKEENEGENK